MRRVSSTLSAGNSRMFTAISRPLTSICGGRPGEKMRSLTLGALRSMTASKPVVETPPGNSAALAMYASGGQKLQMDEVVGGIFNVAKSGLRGYDEARVETKRKFMSD